MRRAGPPSTASAADHVGFIAGGEYDETVAKARVLTARRPPFELLESMRRDPGESIRRLGQHVDRLRSSAAYFGYAFDEGRCER